MPLESAVPFAGILLSIALLPLLAPRFWHRHYGKVAVFWALAFALPFALSDPARAGREIFRVAVLDYFPFVVLLLGLFVVSGGIVVRGAPKASPSWNTGLLAVGTGLASIVGTTGASMLLIRPLLRANAQRIHRAHVVIFFLFLVSNLGGAATPLGDPPLFLGYLRGVPFFWTLRLLPKMAFGAAILLAAFYLIDCLAFRRESASSVASNPSPIRIHGRGNLLYLGGIVLAVLLSGVFGDGAVSLLGTPVPIAGLIRDGAILALAAASLATTPEELRRENAFSWGPMREVAILFAGIFVTILPVLAVLEAGERGALAPWVARLDTPRQYFWTTGLLSSFLDNAPTYLSFVHLQLGRLGASSVADLASHHTLHLEAVAAGAVFMGANTYLGNAPNFLVKAIAEEAGVVMPSFFGYVFRWSLPVLVPLFFVMTLLFF